MDDVTGQKQAYVELRTDDKGLVPRLIQERLSDCSSRIEVSHDAELYVLAIIPCSAVAHTIETRRDCERDGLIARL